MTDRREFEFEIEAPPELVWRALVDPEALLGWFASDARVAPEAGGEYYIAHGEYGQSSTIEEIVPGERLRTRFGETTSELVLEGREGTTFLRIVQSGFGDDDFESLERGWATYMQTLRHYLAVHVDEPAAAAYLYANASRSVEETRDALPSTLPAGADVFDESPRSVGARVPELGDGIYRLVDRGQRRPGPCLGASRRLRSRTRPAGGGIARDRGEARSPAVARAPNVPRRSPSPGSGSQRRGHAALSDLLANLVVIAPDGASENSTPPQSAKTPTSVYADDGGYQLKQRMYAEAAAGHPRLLQQSCRANAPAGWGK